VRDAIGNVKLHASPEDKPRHGAARAACGVTNILLRLWLNDDLAQNRRIDALLAAHGGMPGSLLVTDVVLVNPTCQVEGRRADVERRRR